MPMAISSFRLPVITQKERSFEVDILWAKKAQKQRDRLTFEQGQQVERLVSEIKKGDETSGKPEALGVRYKGNQLMSRRLNQCDRLVYVKHNARRIEILQCGGHYDD